MGVKAIRRCQVYLSRLLKSCNDAGVKERVKNTLKMAKCDCALKGPMAFYDSELKPCGQPECLFCAKKEAEEPAMILDNPEAQEEEEEEEEVPQKEVEGEQQEPVAVEVDVPPEETVGELPVEEQLVQE